MRGLDFNKSQWHLRLILILSCIVWSCSVPSGTEKKIVFITKALNSDYHQTIVQTVKEESGRSGTLVSVMAPESEQNFQFQQEKLQEITQSRNFDAVILAPNHSSALENEIVKLNEAKIPFIIVDTPISIPELAHPENYCGYVGTDNVLGGRLAAKFIGQKIKNGNVVLIRGIPSHRTSADREAGFVQTIGTEYPGIRILREINGQWDADVALKDYLGFLQTNHQRIDAVFSLNDPMAVSIAHFYENKNQRPLIVGFNGDKEAQREILVGTMDASVVQTPENMGRLAVNKLLECLKTSRNPIGEVVYLTPVTLITATRTLTTITMD